MAVEKETIALVWIGGIGLASILSALMINSKRTETWSERRIALVSIAVSIIVVALVVVLV